MSELDELRSRMSAVESQLEELKGGVDYVMTEQRRQQKDVAANTSLCVNLDRDVAALQHQRNSDVKLLDALRRTQVEQGEVLQAHTKTLEEHGRTLGILLAGQVEHGEVLQEHGQILREHSTKLDHLTTRFDGLDTKVDHLTTRFDGLDSRVDHLTTRVDGLDTKVDHLTTRVDHLGTRFDALTTAVDALVTHFGITPSAQPKPVPAQPERSDNSPARTDTD